MKLAKHTVMAGLLAAALAHTASAQVKIYVTGSNAFRATATPQIQAALSGTVTVASTDPDLTAANAVTFTGGNIGGVAVTIKAAYIGSAGGVQAVAGTKTAGPQVGQQFQSRYLPDGATGTANADPTLLATTAVELAFADIAFSDVFQSTTPFGSGKTLATSPDPSSYQGLVDQLVGVVTFRFTASNGFPTGQTMTAPLAQNLFKNPSGVPLALFTGSATDETKAVFAVGRNFDSGTRLTTVAETGIGTIASLQQFQPTISGGVVTSQRLYPINPNVSNLGISSGTVGNDGETTGGALRAFLNATLSQNAYDPGAALGLTAGYYVGYLGVSDSNKVIAATTLPGVGLRYNGVDFSQVAVQNGSYTYWGFEHLFYRSTLGNGTSGGPAVKLTFATNLTNNIKAATSTALSPNVALTDMRVTRTGDGASVTPTYF